MHEPYTLESWIVGYCIAGTTWKKAKETACDVELSLSDFTSLPQPLTRENTSSFWNRLPCARLQSSKRSNKYKKKDKYQTYSVTEKFNIEKYTAEYGAARIYCVFSKCHISVQSESILYDYLNVKEILARYRHDIWKLSDSNEIQTYNHLVFKRFSKTIYLPKKASLAKWSSVRLWTKWLWVWFLLEKVWIAKICLEKFSIMSEKLFAINLMPWLSKI